MSPTHSSMKWLPSRHLFLRSSRPPVATLQLRARDLSHDVLVHRRLEQGLESTFEFNVSRSHPQMIDTMMHQRRDTKCFCKGTIPEDGANLHFLNSNYRQFQANDGMPTYFAHERSRPTVATQIESMNPMKADGVALSGSVSVFLV